MFSTFIDCSIMLTDKVDYNSMPSSGSVSSGSSVSDSSASSFSKKKKSKSPDKTKTPLPLDFEPSNHTVLCGRSRECYEWLGNRRFRVICNLYLQDYLGAPGKLEKSRIVTTVMKTIRQNCKVGAFVTYENGRYYEVSQRTAREKVGGFFRDSLPAEYRSSAKAKLARKKAETTVTPFSSFAFDNMNVPRLSFSTEMFSPQPQRSDATKPDATKSDATKQSIPEQFDSLEESPDFMTGGIFAQEYHAPVQFKQPEDHGKFDFLGATFFDVECV